MGLDLLNEMGVSTYHEISESRSVPGPVALEVIDCHSVTGARLRTREIFSNPPTNPVRGGISVETYMSMRYESCKDGIKIPWYILTI